MKTLLLSNSDDAIGVGNILEFPIDRVKDYGHDELGEKYEGFDLYIIEGEYTITPYEDNEIASAEDFSPCEDNGGVKAEDFSPL